MSITQTRLPSVVVAVDGSGRGTGALRFAIDEARARGTCVRMVHVLDDHGNPGHEIMDSEMAEACLAAPDVEFDWKFGRGQRADVLIEAATAGDLLVLGRSSLQNVERPSLGTVTTEIVSRTRASVVVVPANWRGRSHGRIAVGIKSCTDAGGLLARAFAAASARHAALRVVHVCAAPDPADLVRTDAQPGDRHTPEGRILVALVRDWSAVFPDVAVETTFAHGSPARVLVDAAADADVLLTARHHRDLRHLVRLGRVPRAVLGSSDTPVEVVPVTGAPTPAPLVLESSGTILKN